MALQQQLKRGTIPYDHRHAAVVEALSTPGLVSDPLSIIRQMAKAVIQAEREMESMLDDQDIDEMGMSELFHDIWVD